MTYRTIFDGDDFNLLCDKEESAMEDRRNNYQPIKKPKAKPTNKKNKNGIPRNYCTKCKTFKIKTLDVNRGGHKLERRCGICDTHIGWGGR